MPSTPTPPIFTLQLFLDSLFFGPYFLERRNESNRMKILSKKWVNWEGGLGTKDVTKITTSTGTGEVQDSNPQARRQPTRGHWRCRPGGREQGDNVHYPHPRQTQPAKTIAAYEPCNNDTKPNKFFAPQAHAPATACTKPFLQERTHARPLGPWTWAWYGTTTALCMAWHAQQICGQGHSASTTSVATGGVAMRCNTNKAKQPKRDLPKHNSQLRSTAPTC